MSDYPGAVDSFTTKVDNVNDVMAADINELQAAVVAVETELGIDPAGSDATVKARLARIDLALINGWIADTNTWTYSSVDDPTGIITINGVNATSYLSIGMRIKFVNGGNTIHGIITAISYGAPNTTAKFLHEIDPSDRLALYLMANSAISDNFYSPAKAPFGFPMDPNKWTVSVSDTTNRVQNTPTQNAWYNLGSVNLVVPIGLWRLRGKVNASVQVPTATSAAIYATLSTANNTESNPEFTFYQSLGGASGTIITNVPARMEEFISLAVKTTIYLNTKTGNTGADNIVNQNGNVTSGAVLKAILAYL